MTAVIELLELSDAQTLLRPYRPGDVEPLHEAVRESIDQIGPWMEWCRPNYGRQESEAWVSSRPAAWQEGKEYSFVIVDPTDGALVGSCGLNRLDSQYRLANLGYWIRTSRTRRGFATRAALLTTRFGFEKLGLERIEIVVDVRNLASQRVAEKVAAVREGIARRRLRDYEGVNHDAVLYSLVRSDLGL